jgi:UDP-N-acetylglucosamine transferase subunit ALG13
MIFVTVGTQGQFDRLVRTVDEWAGVRGRADVFAQTGPSKYVASHIHTERFIDTTEFKQRVEKASLVVAHAGMGSIITALEAGKRIIVMPRRASLGEHRNDHQVATAKRFAEQGRILVAFSETELLTKLNETEGLDGSERLGLQASPLLVSAIRQFIQTGDKSFENCTDGLA